MIHRDKLPAELLRIIDNHSNETLNEFEIPPQVFIAMKGEFISFDVKSTFFRCKFPVLNEHLNPYGVMQGGIVSAAIDNTIGPLSMLIAPPSITRKMEVKYSKVIESTIDFIYVTANFSRQKKNFLYFEAIVDDEKGRIKYATAKSTHWIV